MKIEKSRILLCFSYVLEHVVEIGNLKRNFLKYAELGFFYFKNPLNVWRPHLTNGNMQIFMPNTH